jgi:hypothetical protein
MQQDKLFDYNVTLRRVRITVIAVEYLNILNVKSVSTFSLYLSSKHNACAVLYCHLWPIWLYLIFQYYRIKGTIFGEEMSTKFVF